MFANGATGLLNTASLTAMTTAVSGLSKEQALLVLSTKNLTNAQKEQVLLSAGIIATEDKISASVLSQALAKSTLSATEKESLLTKLGLIDATTGEAVANATCTKETLLKTLATKGIVGADADAIISSIGLTTANGAQSVSFDLLTASIWANIKALGKWLITNPIGWAILGGTAIFGLVKAYDALTDSVDEVKDRTDGLMESFNSAISKANENAKSVESVGSRYEELSKGVNSLGENVSLTTDEYSEYNDIVNQIADMFPTLISGYTEEGNAILSLKGNVNELRDAYKEAQTEAYNLLIVSGEDSDGNDIITNYQNQINGNESSWSKNSSYIDGEAGAKDAIDVITKLTGALTPDEFRKAYNDLYEEYKNVWYSDKIQDALKSSGFRDVESKWSEITEEDLANVKHSAQATIQTYNAEIDANLKNVETLANAFLLTNDDYSKLSDQSKTAASLIVNNLNEDIANGFENKEDVGAYVAKIVSMIKDNPDMNDALVGLFTLDTSDMSVDEIKSSVDQYINTIAYYMGEDANAVKIRLGFDDSNTDTLINNVKGKLQDKYDDKVGELSLDDLDIASKLEIPDGVTLTWDELIAKIQEYKDNLENANETSLSFNYSNLDGLESKLSSIQSAYNTATDAIKQYNEQGYLNMDTIDSLLSLSDSYINALFDENGQLQSSEATFQELARIKIEEAKASVYQEACNELVRIKQLDTALAAQELSLANGTLTQSAYDTAQALYEEISAMGGANAKIAGNVWDTANKKVKVLDNQLKNVTKSSYSFKKAYASSGSKSSSSKTTDAIKEAFDAEYQALQHAHNMELISDEQYYSSVSALNDKYYKGNADHLDDYQKYQEEAYKGMKGVYKDYVDSNTKLLKAQLDAGKISYSDYATKVGDMLKEMYLSGKISAEDYFSYVEDKLENQLSIYERALKAVTKVFDDEIDSIDDSIDALNDKNDTLNDTKDNYDSILSVVDKVYSKEIDALKEQQDALQDKIDQINDEADALDLVKRKQEALYALRRAENQRSKLILKDGQFVYSNDKNAVKDAYSDLQDINNEEIIKKLEDEQNALQDSIDILEDYRSKWAEIADAYTNSINEQLAIAKWGEDYENVILQNRASDISQFKDDYISIQQQITNNDDEISSLEEKKEMYQDLKDQWSSISDAYEGEMNRQYASMLLGQNWESDVLSGRLDTLNNFKNNYIAIQQALADAAIASANAQVEAAKNAAVATTTSSTSVSSGSGSSSGSGGSGSSSSASPSADAAIGSANAQVTSTASSKYATYKTVGSGYRTKGQATSQIGMLNGDGVVQRGSLWYVYKKLKTYSTSGKASSRISSDGGVGIIKAKRGAYIGSGSSGLLDSIAKSLGEDTMVAAKEGERILTPVQNNMWEKWTNAMPDLMACIQPLSNFKPYDYANLVTNNNSSAPISVSIGDIQLQGVNNVDTLGDEIVKNLGNVLSQKLNKLK